MRIHLGALVSIALAIFHVQVQGQGDENCPMYLEILKTFCQAQEQITPDQLSNCCSVVSKLKSCYCDLSTVLSEADDFANYEAWAQYCQVDDTCTTPLTQDVQTQEAFIVNPSIQQAQIGTTSSQSVPPVAQQQQQQQLQQDYLQQQNLQQQQQSSLSPDAGSAQQYAPINYLEDLLQLLPSPSPSVVQQSELRLTQPACDPTIQNCPTAPQSAEVSSREETKFVSSVDLLDGYSEAIKSEVSKFEARVNLVADAAVTGYNRRALYTASCPCMHSWCSNTLSNTSTCGFDLGSDSDSCGTCEGVQYDTISGYIGLPPNSNPSNLTTELKASACLMNSINEAIPDLQQLDTKSWAYIGFTTGAFWTWPGRMRGRNTDGDKNTNQCNEYDPRVRPWYHAGSTGPKDVVIVVDKSESMNELVTKSSRRWDVLLGALEKLLDTFTSADWLNVVAFNHKALPLYLEGPLVQGTEANRTLLKQLLAENEPNGNTNFDDGLQKGIEQLIDGYQKGMTSSCTKVIIFLTDGRDNLMEIDNNRASEILDNVEKWQEQLESVTGQRALIFTYSMGDQADDSLPRQIACRNDGQWASISDGDDPLAALNGYQIQVATARLPHRLSWSDPYVDSSGLGEMLSIVKPVYTPEIDDKLPGVLFGVASHDVLLEDLKVVSGPQYEEVLDILISGSRQCDVLKVNTCQQQVYRGELLECPNLIPPQYCYLHDERYYLRVEEKLPWDEAKSACQSQGGILAPVRSDAQLSVLGGMSNPQGSWIGVHYSEDGYWVQEDSDLGPIDDTSKYWGLFQPNNYKGSLQDCVEVDPRGTTGNLNDQLCGKDLTFICEFEDQASCGIFSIVDLNSPSYEAQVPRIEDCVADEALASMRFFTEAEVPSNDVICDMGPPDVEFDELICCPDCQ